MNSEEKRCRICRHPLTQPFLDLGSMPPSNAYLSKEDLAKPELAYPLRVFLCEKCFLMQICDFLDYEKIFKEDYAYYSSFSESWLAHCKAYVEGMVKRLGLGPEHLVVELASNDGYLLQFLKEKRIPVLGVEPCRGVAEAAIKKGVPTRIEFFGTATAGQMAAEGKRADLIVANNVLAHVPDLHDFIRGMKLLLKPGGMITIEFPHVMALLRHREFDTIYHEHFSYFSLSSAEEALRAHDLFVFDLEELSTHGGSLRLYVTHRDGGKEAETRVYDFRKREEAEGIRTRERYDRFSREVLRIRESFLNFLQQAKAAQKTVVGYGAPAKGNTLLNYSGVNDRWIPFTVDLNPRKQGHFLPGSHIPIYSPEKIKESKPDYILILPWNLQEEIARQMADVRAWGGKFVVAIPELHLLN